MCWNSIGAVVMTFSQCVKSTCTNVLTTPRISSVYLEHLGNIVPSSTLKAFNNSVHKNLPKLVVLILISSDKESMHNNTLRRGSRCSTSRPPNTQTVDMGGQNTSWYEKIGLGLPEYHRSPCCPNVHLSSSRATFPGTSRRNSLPLPSLAQPLGRPQWDDAPRRQDGKVKWDRMHQLQPTCSARH